MTDGPTTCDVGVNLLWCLPGEVGGSEEYLARQLAGLARRRAGDPTPRCSCCPASPPPTPSWPPATSWSSRSLDARRRSRRVVAEATWLPPPPGRRRRRPPRRRHRAAALAAPGVLTVHDVQYRTYPRVPDAGQAAVPARSRCHASVRHADVVAVPSEYVRGTVDRRASAATPTASSSCPTASTSGRRDRRRRRVRARYGIGDRPYVVYPALTHPHKNHRFLLDLLAGPWSDPDLALVLLGGAASPRTTSPRRSAGSGSGPRSMRPGTGAGRRPRRPDRRRRGAGVPVRVRGVRGAGARGDGARHAGACAATGPPCPRSPATPRSCGPLEPTRGRARWTRSPRHATSSSPPAGGAADAVHDGGVGPRPPAPTAYRARAARHDDGRPLRLIVSGRTSSPTPRRPAAC